MATIQFKKGDEYLAKISKLDRRLKEDVLGKAIYGAAGIVTDAIDEELRKVPSDESFGTQENPKRGPREVELRSVYNGLGIASMQDDGTGFLNVKVGFDGYSDVKTKRWPNGQPIQMLARSIERGTSFMQANPFVKTAVAKTRKPAIASMKKTVDAEIEKNMKG